MTKLLRTWKYALGSFSDEKTKRYDNHIVLVRTFIFISYLLTNCFIIGGVIRHWNDDKPMACSSEVEQLTVNQPVAGSIPATPV